MDEKDLVNSPSHYNQGGIEAITAIEASMDKTSFHGYLKGNIMKYLWRWDAKNHIEAMQLQDLKKAQWYLNRLVEHVERD